MQFRTKTSTYKISRSPLDGAIILEKTAIAKGRTSNIAVGEKRKLAAPQILENGDNAFLVGDQLPLFASLSVAINPKDVQALKEFLMRRI